MATRPELIQLEPNEDAHSVRDRLSFLRGQRVILVWPEQGTVLTRKLDIVLVQREAMRRAIQLAFVTHDAKVMRHCKELNISAFETIGESDIKRWKRARSRVFTTRWQRPDSEPDPDDLKDVASRLGDEPELSFTQRLIRRMSVLVLLAVVVAAVAYVVLPSATVTFTPAQDFVETSVAVTALATATDIDIENRVIPITRLRVEITKSGTIETTDQLTLGSSRATGSVIFVNRTNSPIQIPAGTSVSTSAGTPILFRTLDNATLAGGAGLQIEVAVEALQDSAGEVGNVNEGMINIVNGPLADVLTVNNLTPTFGGSTDTQSAVSIADIARLEAIVRQQIQADAYVEMLPRLTDTQFVIIETIQIAEERDDWKTFSANVGDSADTVSLTMRAVVEAIAVDEQHARQIAFAQFGNEIPAGREIQPDSIQYQRGAVAPPAENGGITFNMTISGRVVEPYNAAQIQRALIARGRQDALGRLLLDVTVQANTLPEITVNPIWLPHMPLLPLRIHLVVIEDTSP